MWIVCWLSAVHRLYRPVRTAYPTICRDGLERLLHNGEKAVPLQTSWSERFSETLTTYWLLVLVLLIMWLV